MQDDHTPSPEVSDLAAHREQAWQQAQETMDRVNATRRRTIRQARASLERLQRTIDQQRAAQQEGTADDALPPS